MFKKALLCSVALLLASPAWAQNPTCPTRPVGDSSNACASTAFVSTALAGGIPLTENFFLVGNASNLGSGRLIVGADLPNPSTTTLGGAFSLPYNSSAGALSGPFTTTSVLAGIDNLGNPQRAAVTGSAGPVVLSTSPNIVTSLFLNSTKLFDDSANYRVFYTTDGRDALNLGNATVASANVHKATTHTINSSLGVQYAAFEASGLIVTAQNASAFKVGRLGGTTPAFQVDSSVASSVTGISIQGNTSASATVTMTAIGAAAVNLISNVPAATGQHIFSAAGAIIFATQGTASAVNFLRFTNAPSSNVPIISASSSTDPNVALGFSSQATGNINLYTNSSGALQAVILHTASATRNATLTGSNGGNPNAGASAGLLTLNGLLLESSLPAVVQGDILYGSGAAAISALAKNTSATRYLSNTGASNNPAWAQVDLTTGVTGILPVANGGTNVASISDVAATFIPRVLSVQNSGDTNDCASGSGSFRAYNLTHTVPANFLVANRALRITAHYRVTTDTVPTGLSFQLKMGGTVVAFYGPNTPTASITNLQLTNQWIIQSTAAPGASVNTETAMISNLNGIGSVTVESNTAQPVALATNGTLAITIESRWASACTVVASVNQVKLSQFLVEALN